MNSAAPGSHRTGQPRWVQLTEKAMNESWVSRRSHAAVRATTPAQGSGEASIKDTLTVVPIWNDSTRPTARHACGCRSKNGASRKPTNGTPMTAAPTAETAIVSLARKSLRVSGPGGRRGSGRGSAVTAVPAQIVPHLTDPPGGGEAQERHARDDDEPRGDDAEEGQHDAEARRRRPDRPP